MFFWATLSTSSARRAKGRPRPVACGRIDIDALARDRDQLWAEAKVRFDAGSPWWLESLELVNEAAEVQAARFEDDP